MAACCYLVKTEISSNGENGLKPD